MGEQPPARPQTGNPARVASKSSSSPAAGTPDDTVNTPLTERTEPYAFKLRQQGYFPGDQLEKFENINPDWTYKSLLMGEGGVARLPNNDVFVVTMSGQTMRDSIAIYKGMIAMGDKRQTAEFRAQAASDLKSFLESHSGIERGDTAEERKQKMNARVEMALSDVKGHQLYKLMFEDEPIIREAWKPTENAQSHTETPTTPTKKPAAPVKPASSTKGKQSSLSTETEEIYAALQAEPITDRIDEALTTTPAGTSMEDILARANRQDQYAKLASVIASGDWGLTSASDAAIDVALSQAEGAPQFPIEVSTRSTGTKNFVTSF